MASKYNENLKDWFAVPKNLDDKKKWLNIREKEIKKDIQREKRREKALQIKKDDPMRGFDLADDSDD